jgi:hypothetical protein
MMQHLLGLVPGSELKSAERYAAAMAFPSMPPAAARGGHTQLMERLLQLLRADPHRWKLGEVGRRQLLACAAYGCDLATLKQILAEHPVLEEARLTSDRQQEAVLGAAAWSPTPDWRAQVVHLLQLGWRPCELGMLWSRPPREGGTEARGDALRERLIYSSVYLYILIYLLSLASEGGTEACGDALRERLRWLVEDEGFRIGELACRTIFRAWDEPAALIGFHMWAVPVHGARRRTLPASLEPALQLRPCPCALSVVSVTDCGGGRRAVRLVHRPRFWQDDEEGA